MSFDLADLERLAEDADLREKAAAEMLRLAEDAGLLGYTRDLLHYGSVRSLELAQSQREMVRLASLAGVSP